MEKTDNADTVEAKEMEVLAPEHDPEMAWLVPENFVPPPKWRVDMKRLLDSVEYEGHHYTSFELQDSFGFSVKGAGDFSSWYDKNYSKEFIEKLKTVAEKAPYGKQDKTIVDETVRKTWKIRSDLVSFYRDNLISNNILPRVKTELGVANLDVEARLHNVLIYEEGSFFKLHTDSEKEPGMFGTMAVQNNSVFSGGSMKIQHNGTTSTIELAKHRNFVTAWYADCPHELEPVTSGVRIVFVYNLINKSAGKVSVEQTDAPRSMSPFLAKMSPILDVWQASNETIAKNDNKNDALKMPDDDSSDNATVMPNHAYRAFVYPLDHKYTMNGLTEERHYEYEVTLRDRKNDSVLIEGGEDVVDSDEESYYEDNNESQNESSEGNSGNGEDANASTQVPENPKGLRWEDAMKGRDRNVVRLLQQCGMSVTICVQDVVVTTSSECRDQYLDKTKCMIVQDGKLVESMYQPRGYCSSQLYVMSKKPKDWLNEQMALGKMNGHYDMLDESELEPYTGNEGQDAYGWYRSTFLVVEAGQSAGLDRKRKARD